jgi:hypothetical protein
MQANVETENCCHQDGKHGHNLSTLLSGAFPACTCFFEFSLHNKSFTPQYRQQHMPNTNWGSGQTSKITSLTVGGRSVELLGKISVTVDGNGWQAEPVQIRR